MLESADTKSSQQMQAMRYNIRESIPGMEWKTLLRTSIPYH
jgi:hypothetical protein